MKPKVLFYDIEVSANEAYVWGKYEQNVLGWIKQWEVLSVSYRWQGSNKVHTVTRQDKKNDLNVLKHMRELFERADLLVAHNGDKFDFKKLTARMVYFRLSPVKPIATVDTLKIAKKYFAFNGNSLADLGEYLGIGGKVKHHGFPLWKGCMQDDPASWRLMVKYNRQDVNLLEEVYDIFRPWIQNHPNLAKLLGKENACPTCASSDVIRWGRLPTTAGVRQRWACRGCSRFFTAPISRQKKEAA